MKTTMTKQQWVEAGTKAGWTKTAKVKFLVLDNDFNRTN
jgi:hypothetical protein